MKRNMIMAVLIAAMGISMVSCGVEGGTDSNVEEPSTEAVTEEVTEETTEETTEATTEAPANAVTLIGEDLEADGLYINRIAFTNNSGMDIKELSVKADFEEEYPENMIKDGVFAKDTTADLVYKFPPNPDSMDEYGENTPLLTTEYTVKIVFEDDTVAVLHQFPFGDIEAGEVYLEDGIAFIKYNSLYAEVLVDTKEAEEMIKSIEAENTDSEDEADSTEGAEVVVDDYNSNYDSGYTDSNYVDYGYSDPNYYYEDPNTYYEDPNTYYGDPNTYYDPNSGCLGGDALFN